MSNNQSFSNNRAVYRLVNKRLGWALMLILLITGTSRYFLEQHWLLSDVQEIAIKRANEYISLFGKLLTDQQAVDDGVIQKNIEEFAETNIIFSEGYIASGIVRDNRGKIAVLYHRNQQALSPSIDNILEQTTEMNSSQLNQMMANRITIDNQLYILLHFPVKNTAGKTMGQAAMLFLPAEERLQEIQTHVWQRTLTALVIVMITMLFIYPVIIRLTRQLSTLSTNLLNANLQTATALGNAIAKRDSDTDIHNYRVTIYSVRLAEALKLDTLTMQGLIKGAFLHDVGKIGTPDSILLKPGPLTDAEFTEMKKHVKHGVDIIKSSVWLQDAEDVVFFHHAKYNGGGYTASKEILLRGKDIPLVARIFAIVDVFDALSSHRPYKPSLDFETTLAEMEKNVGSHFDPELFVTFKTIARPLYDELADRQDELPRTLLTTIVKKYFLDDLEQLLS
jgi:HD-GYP domain-containing protein (c-di-GMP phosphodiesterase class II)